MTRLRTTATSMALAAFIAFGPAQAEDKAQVSTDLQIAMQRHIERSLVEGSIVHIDIGTGKTDRLYPTKAHPMIMKADEYFVLCADLRNEDGEKFEVDYYMVETARGYKVIRTEVDNRKPLKQLLNAGFVTRF